MHQWTEWKRAQRHAFLIHCRFLFLWPDLFWQRGQEGENVKNSIQRVEKKIEVPFGCSRASSKETNEGETTFKHLSGWRDKSWRNLPNPGFYVMSWYRNSLTWEGMSIFTASSFCLIFAKFNCPCHLPGQRAAEGRCRCWRNIFETEGNSDTHGSTWLGSTCVRGLDHESMK